MYPQQSFLFLRRRREVRWGDENASTARGDKEKRVKKKHRGGQEVCSGIGSGVSEVKGGETEPEEG